MYILYSVRIKNFEDGNYYKLTLYNIIPVTINWKFKMGKWFIPEFI